VVILGCTSGSEETSARGVATIGDDPLPRAGGSFDFLNAKIHRGRNDGLTQGIGGRRKVGCPVVIAARADIATWFAALEIAPP